MANENNSNQKKRTSKAGAAMGGLLMGRSFLSLDFFRRNFLFIIFITGLMLMYIGNKFECQSKMQEVMTLRTELENAKTDCVNASAKYNSMIRESQMKAFVDTMHIDLTNPECPPYYLTKK
ncbi:MAG: hypothetical protein J6I72_02785 [Muribaculaceae bacterium]|nr:hypothetical protein [Muribaculaceae bacterium]